MADYKENSSAQENLVYGKNAVLELLKSGKIPDVLYVADLKAKGSIPQILSLARQRGAVVKEAAPAKLDTLAEGGNHQGVVAQLSPIEYTDLDDILVFAREKGEDPFLVLADEIEDPHNLGALIRTADAAGAHGLVIPKRRSATVNATVYKTSAGACAHLPVARVTNLAETIQRLKQENIWVYGADMRGQPLWQANLSGPVALVIGSEGKGLGRLIKERCDALISLPMLGQVNSLNASVAGGICMYEIVRQRTKK